MFGKERQKLHQEIGKLKRQKEMLIYQRDAEKAAKEIFRQRIKELEEKLKCQNS